MKVKIVEGGRQFIQVTEGSHVVAFIKVFEGEDANELKAKVEAMKDRKAVMHFAAQRL